MVTDYLLKVTKILKLAFNTALENQKERASKMNKTITSIPLPTSKGQEGFHALQERGLEMVL